MSALFSDYDDLKKSGLFAADYYLAAYPDVAARNIDPLVHFLEEGAREGRNPHPDFDAAFYLEQCRLRGETTDNPLLHYLRIGATRGFKTRRETAAPAPPQAQQAEDGRPAPVLVAVEAAGVAGGPAGASRLSVSGWALAATPITEITVALDGIVRGSAKHGLARPDVAARYPERAAAPRSGFILSCELPALKEGAVEASLSVRTADGSVGRQALRIPIPPRDLGGSGGGPPPAGKVPMQLFIDRAAFDSGGLLRVEGWVVCLVQIDAVEVFVDGQPIGKAALGQVRPDVEETHADYPNSRFSGFLLVGDIGRLGAGRKTITVKALARSGVAAEAAVFVALPEEAVAAPPPAAEDALHHHCDEIILTTGGRLAVHGWIVGPAPSDDILVLLDDEEIGHAAIGFDRPEIGNLFPRLHHARQSGFAFEAATGRPLRGSHRVTLLVSGADRQTREVRLSAVAAASRYARDVVVIEDADCQLYLDTPEIIAGATEAPIRGNLQIGGWALTRAGVAEIEIALDGTPIAYADYGVRRLDIRAAFPDRAEALTSGFTALVPHRLLPKGAHTVSVTLRDKAGATARNEFRIEVEEVPDAAGPWSLRRTMPPAESDLGRRLLARCGWQPLFIAVLPVRGKAELRQAEVTIASLYAQAYANWRLLVVARPAAGKPERVHAALLAGASEGDERVEVVASLGCAALTGPAAAAGDAAAESFVTVLTPGDECGVDALLEMALAAAVHRDADFLYSEERCPRPETGRIEPFFKPQWSPELMLSANYIGRLWCARADLLAAIADPDRLLDLGEYDLLLRCTEVAKAIRHVPAVLCERGDGAGDTAAQRQKAVERALARRGIEGRVLPGRVAGSQRVERALVAPGLVSIIIPTCAAQGMIEACITSLRRLTAYRDYEIICIENIPNADSHWRDWLRRNADRVISTREPFNWSRFNNLAAAEARGSYLLFLNDDVEITDPDWLGNLLREAQRPEVGVVGPQLLYPDGRVQHAGMFLAAIGQGRHAFRYAASDEPGYFGLALTQRNVIAVTGACLMTRRATFDALGGFEEAHGIINNDVDYCLRAWQSGLANLYTPHARLIHHEAVSRAALDDEYDVAAFDGRWRHLFVAGDPFFSPHLSKMHDHFTIDDEPIEVSMTGRPALAREAIRRILVVKLDHIGDCITAFPAVRRLKQHFPRARISVLTSRTSRPVWAFEPAVEQVIEFDFFHPRSAMGELERTAAEWAELAERLAPERFDLAVDLRKHIETRPVLQHSGARWLAGFDHQGRFAWLDIALEWGGDHMSMRQRQWAGDDLVNLVDAIGAACEGDRAVIALPPQRAAGLAARRGAAPVIWVHPTSGNDIKQWPVEYFAIVIDQLVERHGARIFLTGAPGDEAAATGIVAQLRHPEAVTSMIGRSPLAELPELMAGAALFLGNDSGLKHIAAGLGIPTVGVHGGTLDPREWGGVGPNAVMIARNMVCSPCYLASVEDCRRGVACLRQLEPGRVYEACERLLLLSEPVQEAAAADRGQTAARRARKRSTARTAASARAASRSSS